MALGQFLERDVDEATRAFLTSLQQSTLAAEPLASAVADSSCDSLKLASRGIARSIYLRRKAVFSSCLWQFSF